MAAADNFVYDSDGNLIEDKSKRLKISYDWRGMPVEFMQYPPQENTGVSGDTLFRLTVAYDYRAFGEQIDLVSPSSGKVTENFTGKEKDDETELNYFGARYLDPMLGVWTSVDPMRQFSSPYLYAGNGFNPVNAIDPDGDKYIKLAIYYNKYENGDDFDAEVMAAKYKEYISSRIDMSVNTVEVKAFAEGSTTDLEMTSWLSLGQPDLPAIMTHGGEGVEFISDVPYVTKESTIDFETLNYYLKTKTYLGACFAKDNLEAANGKYDKLYGPEQYGITTNPITLEYLVKNADVAPKKDEE